MRPSKLSAATAAAAALYLLSLRAYYVGFFNDDAFYIIGARSLLGGRYAELNAPGHPPLVNYFPGYSMLLAPIAALHPARLLSYQILSVILTVSTLLLLRRWLGASGASDRVTTAAVLVAAFNPLTVSHSGVVLSELPLAFFLLLSLLALRRAWDKEASIDWVLPVVLMGVCALLRPEAVFLPFSAAAVQALRRRWRLAGLCLLSLLGVFAFCIRNFILERTWLVYGIEIADPYRSSPLTTLLQNAFGGARYYLDLLFAKTFFRMPADSRGLLSAAVVAAGSAGTAIGAYRKKKGDAETVLQLYLAIVFAVFFLWTKRAGRYLLPALPFLSGYLFAGIESLSSTFEGKRRLVAGTCVVSLICCAFPDCRIVRASLVERTPINVPARGAYAWVQNRTTPADLFAAEWDGRFFLRTGREALHLPRPSSPEALGRWLTEHRVRYVFVEPSDFALTPANRRAFNAPWESPELNAFLVKTGRCRLAFEGKSSGAAIYRVVL
jgi:4-amino-4-deoxy-L-arabinose transferase-like glycosyltransferase